MYAWIWRHIPFRRPELKALVALVLIGVVSALLWFEVFPAVEPILPFDDGQIENTDGLPADGEVPGDVVSPGPSAIPSIVPSVRSSR
jgi:hypothetical protein